MVEETAIQAVGVKSIDSLSANEFAVQIEGEKIDGIFKVSGLVSFKLDVKTTTSLKAIKEPFKIIKMVQRDPNNAFNQWLRESVAAQTDIVRPKRTLSITAMDEGVETRRWTVKGAWITSVAYSDFDTGSNVLVEETLTIQWDVIEETWPTG
jgi:phage tail-like protein